MDIVAYVDRRKHVGVTIKAEQVLIVWYVQGFYMVIDAAEFDQIGIVGSGDFIEAVPIAIQIIQKGVFAQVKVGQLIANTFQKQQFRIVA